MNRKAGLRSERRLMLVAISLALFSLSVAAGFSAARPARAAQTWNVTIGDNYFYPSTITINVGDTVTWTNSGSMVHTTTANPGQAEFWDSGGMSGGATFSHAFTNVGNFTYICQYHAEMQGTVVVVQPAPEFPGYMLFAVVGMAVAAALLMERGLRK
jgi:plastocyanin